MMKNVDFRERKLKLELEIQNIKFQINMNGSCMNAKFYNELLNRRIGYKAELRTLLKREKLYKKLIKVKNG
jgi:hypothetical protein